MGALALFAAALPAASDTIATLTVCETGCDFATLPAAIAAAAPLDEITVAAGSYSGNAVIDKAITIRGAGIGQSTLVGTSGQGALGTLVIASGVSNVTIEGFTIEGIDNGTPAVENAAVYIQGAGHDAITVRNNRIVANGDLALASEYASTMTNVTVTGNTFSGKTYTGSAPASAPFSQQFTTANVARQFVVFGNGGGAGTSNVSGFVFTGNTIDGSAGVGAYGNTLATLDVSGATITGNTFAGQTGGSATMLRVRRGGNTISGNAFTTTGVQGSASALYVENQTLPLSTIVGANTFDRGVYVDATGTGTVGVGLSAAVAAVPAGTTLRVVGTHTFGSTLEVNKALTIAGAGIGATTLDFRTSNAYGVRTSASGITVRDLKILGPTTHASASYAFKAEGAATTTKVTGLTVASVEITGSRKTALDINGYDGVTVSNVTVTGTTNGRGIALTDVDNATLSDITTSGNAWGGVAISVYGRYAPLGSANVAITGLTASETQPLDWDLGNYNAPGTLVTPANFTGPAGYDAFVVRRPSSGTPPATFTLWSFTPSQANALAMAGLVNNSVIVRPGNRFLVGSGMSLPAALTAAAAVAGSSVEDASGNFHVAAGMAVQPAIDAASAGATINIAAGTYSGGVNINKSVRLVGAGADALTGTVITASTGAQVVNLTASGTLSNPIALENMRISAVGRYGINVNTGSVAHVLLDHVHVIGNNPTDQTENSTGLKVGSIATLTDLTIRDSRFDDLQYGWYLAKDMPSTSGSTVNRVTVLRTAFAHNAGKGIYAEKLSNASFTDVSVMGNGHNSGQFNAPFNAGIDMNLKGNDVAYQNLSFTNLTVTGNALGQQHGVGMTVKARSDGSYGPLPATLTGVTITGGTFSGNEAGIRIGEPGKANPGPTGVVISGVTFGANTQQWTGGTGLNRALINESTAAVNAENNWWGSADEAIVNARIVNASTGSVDADPWTGKPVATPAPVVNTPVTPAGTPVELTFTSLPATSQPVTVRFEPTTPDASTQTLPDPATSIPGATATLPATLTMTTPMSNYTFRTTVTLDVSSIPGFGPTTQVAYYNTTTNSYVPVQGSYAAGPPTTFTFTTDHFTTFVFYNGSVADPMDLYVSRTTAVPATGEEYVTPSGAWSDAGNDADDWLYTGQTATFHVVPSFPAAFDGFSSMRLVFSFDPTVMTYAGAAFNGDWGFTQCQNGVPAAGRVTCDLSLVGTTDVATSMTGAVMSLDFTVTAPGYSHVDVIGADIRKLDGLGGQSGVAVTTHGGGLRNYLGDVVARTGASTTDATMGDGKIDFDDLTVFTQSYWAGVSGYSGTAVYRDKADVGPTTGARARTVYGTPSLDGKVDFEDLVIFAASYGLSARSVYPQAQQGADEVEQDVRVVAGTSYASGDLVAVPVEISTVRDLRGGSFLVDLGAGVQLVGARMRGDLVGQNTGLAMARMEGGLARVDAAVLGDQPLAGSGVMVELLVRASASVSATVTSADLRDVFGQSIRASVLKTTAVDALPTVTELALESVFPNPSRGRVTIRVAVPTTQAIDVTIYDVLGREVTSVVRGEMAAGRHDLALSTDGFASGLYIVRMRAGAFSRTQTLTVVQ